LFYLPWQIDQAAESAVRFIPVSMARFSLPGARRLSVLGCYGFDQLGDWSGGLSWMRFILALSVSVAGI
jgi:hypothetical protein